MSNFSKYFEWGCRVGGIDKNYPKGEWITGHGGFISPSLVISALHCWSKIKDKCNYPVIRVGRDLHQCEIIYENEKMDVAVYKCINFTKTCEFGYPAFNYRSPNIGEDVEFISQIEIEEENNPIAFFKSHIFYAHDDIVALSPMFSRTGSSGSLIYYSSDKSLMGILIRKTWIPHVMRHNAEEFKQYPGATDFVGMPIISPICLVWDEIIKLKGYEPHSAIKGEVAEGR